jgi:aminobenzoyl-glutamate transport protein
MTEADNRLPESAGPRRRTWAESALDVVEWLGNKLPDPAALFLLALVVTWVASLCLAPIAFSEIDPRTIRPGQTPQPIQIRNQLTGEAMVAFLTKMVKTFIDFPPLGLVLVALLGMGVAEHTGFINALIKGLLGLTPARLLTPMLIIVGIISHSAGDSGHVLLVPLGGVIFSAAGRHPLAGIAAAFAGVSGGLSASFVPIALDPLLQGFTQSAVRFIDPAREVNPLCNFWFTSSSTLLIIFIGWYLTDRVIEPRLAKIAVDGAPGDMPRLEALSRAERRGLWAGIAVQLLGLAALSAAAWSPLSPLRTERGELTGAKAPLMEMIVPLIFLFFFIPGIVYGYVAGTVKSHRDIVTGMSKSMSTMGYYLVLAFFAAQFTYAFGESNLGALLAIKGANFLQWLRMPAAATIVGIIVITALLDLLIASASAKWALLGPIFVPMLMQLGLAPELTQAAYRIGDSTSNVIGPLMPYFPLIVVYCQRYVKSTGIGTLVSLMMPYSICYLISWTMLLLAFWQLGIPLGIDAPYEYP